MSPCRTRYAPKTANQARLIGGFVFRECREEILRPDVRSKRLNRRKAMNLMINNSDQAFFVTEQKKRLLEEAANRRRDDTAQNEETERRRVSLFSPASYASLVQVWSPLND